MADSTGKIQRALRQRGYITEITRGAHIKITHPTRRGLVFTSATPGDSQRGQKNLDRDLRKTFGEETGA